MPSQGETAWPPISPRGPFFPGPEPCSCALCLSLRAWRKGLRASGVPALPDSSHYLGPAEEGGHWRRWTGKPASDSGPGAELLRNASGGGWNSFRNRQGLVATAG